MFNRNFITLQRYFIKFSYKGTAYHGSQIQPNAISIQEVLEDKLSRMTREEVKIVAAGRTDAGVHASEMYAHIDFETFEPDDKFLFRLNGFLPKDIAVQEFTKVKHDAHARFDAVARSYEYHITQVKNVFGDETQYYIKQTLDVDAMNEACKVLFEYTDFEAFSKLHSDVFTFNCEIKEAVWKQSGDTLIFKISADRFLRNMVRAIVGTLLKVGKGQLDNQGLRDVIESKNRGNAGESVPAKGLFLTRVSYPDTVFI